MESQSAPLVAIVGGDTLLAKELREVLRGLSTKLRIEMFAGAATVEAAVEEEEEAEVLTPLTAKALKAAKVVFLAGSQASSRRAAKLIPSGGAPVVDLTSALEEQSGARLRAPSAEPAPITGSSLQIIAHPAAIAVAALLKALSADTVIRRSLVHVFEPASERGQRGLDELQQQTVAVLAFKKLKTDVYDTQLAFNTLARFGEEAEESLESIEQRLERHLASLLSELPAIPMPSLRLVQAPVFHGHSMSVWVEFADTPDVDRLALSLAAQGLDVRPDEPPNNAGIAGQSGLSVGAITADRNSPRAAWFWLVADNFRLPAENAAALAAALL